MLIQTALAAQATIHQQESESRERVLIKDFEAWLLEATAVNNKTHSSRISDIFHLFNGSQNLPQYGGFCYIQRIRRDVVHICYV